MQNSKITISCYWWVNFYLLPSGKIFVSLHSKMDLDIYQHNFIVEKIYVCRTAKDKTGCLPFYNVLGAERIKHLMGILFWVVPLWGQGWSACASPTEERVVRSLKHQRGNSEKNNKNILCSHEWHYILGRLTGHPIQFWDPAPWKLFYEIIVFKRRLNTDVNTVFSVDTKEPASSESLPHFHFSKEDFRYKTGKKVKLLEYTVFQRITCLSAKDETILSRNWKHFLSNSKLTRILHLAKNKTSPEVPSAQFYVEFLFIWSFCLFVCLFAIMIRNK